MNTNFNSELPETRRQAILEQLKKNGKVTTQELTRLFNTSPDTIRRDLRDLAKAGQLTKVHGGALPVAPVLHHAVAQSASHNHPKIALAKAAAQLLEDGQVILFDGGTTTLEISRQLNPTLKATVITVSPQIAITLSSYINLEVILLGGKINPYSLTTGGSAAIEQLQQLRADICLLGVCSLHPKIGLSALDYEEAQIKKALVQSSSDIVAVVTADKLNTAVPYTVCTTEQITHLVTEKQVTQEQLRPYQQAGIEIIQA